jgi:hypothetical protein
LSPVLQMSNMSVTISCAAGTDMLIICETGDRRSGVHFALPFS